MFTQQCTFLCTYYYNILFLHSSVHFSADRWLRLCISISRMVLCHLQGDSASVYFIINWSLLLIHSFDLNCLSIVFSFLSLSLPLSTFVSLSLSHSLCLSPILSITLSLPLLLSISFTLSSSHSLCFFRYFFRSCPSRYQCRFTIHLFCSLAFT